MSEEPTIQPTSDEPTEAPPAPVPTPAKKSSVFNPYVWGTGRRKTAVAQVRIRPGEGKFVVNKKELEAFFCIDRDRASARKPLTVTDSMKSYDVFVTVRGGGITGQAEAVLLGLSRALVKADSNLEPKLREHQLLSRDARKVERKKYGRAGARRRFQFSKR